MNKSIKWSIKAVVKDLKYFRDLTVYSLTRADVKEKPLVRYYEKGSLTPSYDKPVCLFCSYDKESLIRDSVYRYLDALVLAGFDIVFISSSDAISETNLQKLSEYCIRIMNRENKGYDFYGWKTGLEKYPQYNAHSGLLLTNDSVLGPLFSIKDIVIRLENCDADIIGMTDCFRFYPHLQSYFLYCKKNVVLSEEFIQFFNEVSAHELKMVIIRKYEVGFSRLLGHRFRLSALYSVKNVLARVNYHERPIRWIEPTLQLWKPLITEFRFPFVKKNIWLRKGVRIEEISAVLAECDSTYDLDVLTD